jgi:hypothetical protein
MTTIGILLACAIIAAFLLGCVVGAFLHMAFAL